MSADTVEGAALVLAKLGLAPSNARRTKPASKRIPATQSTPAAIREPAPVPAANDATPAWQPDPYVAAWAERRALAEVPRQAWELADTAPRQPASRPASGGA